ncbi:MAG TPA: hypothetical protein PLN33_06495 [Hyphomonadaceae bacterium]|nr:hypothetical protein [Hyphomonadaceae bacterium]HPN04400.1 hypothetical protein [Hyphomonadaceae bacterium]
MKFVMAAAAAALMLSACSGENAAAPTDGATPAAGTPAAAPAAAGNPMNGPIAGEWEATITAGGMTVPAAKICYDRRITMEEAQKMQQGAGVTCTEETNAPDGKSGHSVCTMQGMKITSDYKVTGDFNTAYTMDVTASIDPAPPGMPNPSTTSIKMTYVGPQCAPETPKATPAQ